MGAKMKEALAEGGDKVSNKVSKELAMMFPKKTKWERSESQESAKARPAILKRVKKSGLKLGRIEERILARYEA